MWTKHSYLISYRVQFHGDSYAETTALVAADEPLSEFRVQQACLDNLPSCPDIPDGVRTEDFIITRFHYVSLSPVLVPDVSRDEDRAPDPDA
jgi:hypothetical protein